MISTAYNSTPTILSNQDKSSEKENELKKKIAEYTSKGQQNQYSAQKALNYEILMNELNKSKKEK
ncbi:hypothetical protein J2Z32_003451 [Paenibacillus turicensis]|uniref:Uncharacterized protein n=1 Tax=Paenibacillus turicensis TaxID=160487 RepID=A0ABS4FW31_9BACL|nr:hypothetical protein [Paenibacillus turicensis]MBP1906787.1 hypothetical protein [Paenibacillus turicensis]